jgi:hypothetical protein
MVLLKAAPLIAAIFEVFGQLKLKKKLWGFIKITEINGEAMKV